MLKTDRARLRRGLAFYEVHRRLESMVDRYEAIWKYRSYPLSWTAARYLPDLAIIY